MIVTVTQEDIDVGIERNCYHCPVARAIQRNYLPTNFVQVYDGMFLVKSTVSMKEDHTYRLPWHVTNWINDFDSGYPVKPIEFEVEV